MVYVDDMKAQFGRMIMCHMVADTLEELHAMADKIGVSRRWFQNNSKHPHYDICLSKRALAVKFGAVEITQREMVLVSGKKQPDGLRQGEFFNPYDLGEVSEVNKPV